MPLYEYRCAACREEFELLLLPHSKDAPECPSCHSRNLEQVLSSFAVNSAERSRANWKTARAKYEKTELRDKKVAEAEAVNHHLHDH